MNWMLDPLGFDAALKKADFPQPIRTGGERMAHFKAILRRFNKVTQSSNEGVMAPLSRWVFDQLSINGLPLDRDDPLRRTRTGAQGSHPAKRGRCQSPSLDGLCGRPRMIANCWLRPGNSSSANNGRAFWAKTLYRRGGKHVSLLRADSGLSETSFLDHLDHQPFHDIVALRQNHP